MNAKKELDGILAPYGSLLKVSIISKVGVITKATKEPELPGPVDSISFKVSDGPGPENR